MWRIKVTGRATAPSPFDMDVHVIAGEGSAIFEPDGSLVVRLPPHDAYIHPSVDKLVPATRSRKIVYPRGGWDKAIVEEIDK